MTKVLVVGDVHATVEELGDCQALVDFVCKTALDQEVKEVVFLGDIYHTMAVVRVEVIEFWRKAFRQIPVPVTIVMGNHDMPGNDASTAHALLAHYDTEGIRIIDKPVLDEELGALFLPYMNDHEKFLELARGYGAASLLFCHQTFNGAQYENGFYAKDGIDPSLIDKAIVSGHIHRPSEFANVWYPGAPRWRSFSDANTSRAVWVLDIQNGQIQERTSFALEGVCRPIYFATVAHSENTLEPYVQNGNIDMLELMAVHKNKSSNSDFRVDIRGTKAQIQAFEAKYSAPGVRMRTFPEEESQPTVKVKESEGVPKALRRFSEGFAPRFELGVTEILEEAERRLGW